MSETKTIRAIKPIDGQPAGTVLNLSPEMAEFLIQGGAAEEVKPVAAKSASNGAEGGEPRKNIELNPDVSKRLTELAEGRAEKQSKENK